MTAGLDGVAERVVRWQATHGRNHLPWQATRDPYRVWLSEIMLQQTQVTTVLGYYDRFLQRFPDVQSLAAAPEDAVLSLWAGLGYYSRARNLHRCAQAVVDQWGGRFPSDAAALASLPGIGRSTAGAIAAFCFAQRSPILDANVRRVLTRHAGFDKDLSVAAHERELWEHAERLLPVNDLAVAMPRYTQGLMDLGAQVCLPRKPACGQCPLAPDCVAARQGAPERYPVRSRKLVRRSQAWWLLLLTDPAGRLWLERRPAKGIWGGLYCPPAYDNLHDLEAALGAAAVAMAAPRDDWPAVLHVLTHRDLHLHPVRIQVQRFAGQAFSGGGQWFAPAQWADVGLPAAVRGLLPRLRGEGASA